MTAALGMFLFFVLITLVITYWAARRSKGAAAFFTASRRITGWQNGVAVAGDYMSAASFLGIAGLIAFYGYDGFMFSVGWLVAYLTVLLVVAEPLRNAGKYTMADVLAYRLNPRPVRAMAALSTLTVSTFYMIAQMVGAGALVTLLLGSSHVSYQAAVLGVGLLMIIYVVFGGMLATTWVQIIKAILLMAGTILLSLLVLAHFGWSFANFFEAVTRVTYHDKGAVVTKNFLEPGLRYTAANHGPLDLISLGMALVFGTAGLPHILVRFYTVPDARTARISVVWAMVLIGSFYIMTTFLGFGAATIVGRDFISAHGGNNMSAPASCSGLGGRHFLCLHCRHCIRDHPRSRCRPNDQRLDFVCSRFLHGCHSQGHGAATWRRSKGRAYHGVLRRRRGDRNRDCAGQGCQRCLFGRARLRCRRFGQPPGDRFFSFLETV